MAKAVRTKKDPVQSTPSDSICWKAFEYYSSLKRVSEHVGRFPDDALNLDRAASIAGLERTYFSAFFHGKTRVTFKYWNDWRRITRAAMLLQTCDDSITAISEKCGFVDLSTFERTFGRILGVTPRAYKRKHQPM